MTRSTFIAIPFSGARPDLLDRALVSLPYDLLVFLDVKSKLPLNITRHNTRVNFSPGKTYAQSMVDFQHFAERACVKFWLHMHSDGVGGEGDYDRLIAKAEELNAAGRKWAVIFTLHDVLACYNTEAIEAIGGWDQTFPMYFFDNNNYRRLKLAGYEFALLENNGVIHGDNGVGSQTISSDPIWKRMNTLTFPMYQEMYRQMWGGNPGEETFNTPWER